MHFHEALKQSIHDFEHERQQLEELFSNTKWRNIIAFMGQPSAESLEMYLENDFRRSRVRGTASSFKSFFAYHAKHWKNPSLGGLFYYAEMMLNILDAFSAKINRNPDAKSIACQIETNIDRILEETIHTTIRTSEGFIAIIPKDPLVAKVIADLPNTDKETTGAILEYTQVGLQGNVVKKRELLVAIGRHVEPILDDPKMKEFCNWLLDDVSSCLNNLHIRHNNQEGKKKNDLVGAMNAQELETIYDETYRAMLLLIEMQKHRPVHEKIKATHKHLEESRSAKGRGKAGEEASPHAAKRRSGREARDGGVERGRVETEGQ